MIREFWVGQSPRYNYMSCQDALRRRSKGGYVGCQGSGAELTPGALSALSGDN